MKKFEEEDSVSHGSSFDESHSSLGISRTNSSQSGVGGHSDSGGSGSDKFTGAETKYVNRSKLLVYFALAIAAAAVSSVAYINLRDDEEKTMKVEVSNHIKC